MLIHQLLEQWAKHSPNNRAVQFEGNQSITYKELNDKVVRLANFLYLKKGVVVGSKVCVCLDRSVERIVALLALAKLGAVYVPFEPDPGCPLSRFKEIIQDVQPLCVLHAWQEIPKECEDADIETTWINLSENQQPIDRQPIELQVERSNLISLESLFYIIYTSGSTGKPKGVMIAHKGLEYWSTVQKKLFQLTSKSKIADKISANFDAHIWQVLMSLTAGGCLYIASNETRKDSERLTEFIKKHQITDITLTPSELRGLQRHLKTLRQKGLRAIYSTGEACTLDIVQACKEADVNLWNCYGPTELTFGMSVKRVIIDDLHDNRAPIAQPYNNPPSNIQAYLINENGKQITKEEEEGELVIVSPYVMQGYFNQLAQTEESFITINGRRAYRTGDICVRKASCYYFLRRQAESVKVNGVFVDLREVEQHIRNAGCQDACVIPVHLAQGTKLVACVERTEVEKIEEIKRQLSEKLPPQAVPFSFYSTTLLKNDSGKIDKKKLTEKVAKQYLNGSFLKIENSLKSPPKTTTETKVADVWKEKLSIESGSNLNRDAMFADISGDSITINEVVSRINELFAITLSVSELPSLNELTIAIMASLIQQQRWMKDPTGCLSTLHKGNQEAQSALFFLPPITGAADTYNNLAKELSSLELPIYALKARGTIDLSDVSYDLEAIAKDYARAIMQEKKEGTICIAGWSFGATLTWKVAEILEQKQRQLIVIFIDGCAPGVYQKMALDKHAEELQGLLEMLKDYFKKNLNVDETKLQKTGWKKWEKTQQIDYVFSCLSSNEDQVTKMLAVARAHLHMQLTCRLAKLKSVPRLFACQSTITRMGNDKLLGWDNHGSITFDANIFEVDHLDLMRQPERLANTLKKVITPTTSPIVGHKRFRSPSFDEELKKLQAACTGFWEKHRMEDGTPPAIFILSVNSSVI